MNTIRFKFIKFVIVLAAIVSAPSAIRADGLSSLLGGSHVQPGWNNAAPPYPSAGMFPDYGPPCSSSTSYGPGGGGPYGGGGFADYGGVECGPSWYDFSVEGMYLDRRISGKSDIDLISDNPGNTAVIVLSASDADFEFEAGIRATLRYQLNATDSIEGVYVDGLDWESTVTVNDSDIGGDMNDLFSVFSQFGQVPIGGFEETDATETASLTYRSNLESVEFNFRRGWISRNARIHGSWIGGLRYLRLNEQFSHAIHWVDVQTMGTTTTTSTNLFNYDINTRNDLLGFQGGAKVGWCLMPGLIAHSQIKAGVYGNKASQNSRLVNTVTTLVSTPTMASSSIATTLDVPESAKDDVISFATDASAWMTWQLHPLVKIRCGYEVWFMQGLALGPDNFNTSPPAEFTPTPTTPARQVFLDDQGEVLYHGARLGLEVGW